MPFDAFEIQRIENMDNFLYYFQKYSKLYLHLFYLFSMLYNAII